MATRYWLGVSSDWSSTANWAASSGGAGGSTVPVTADVVYIDRGTNSITAGLNQSAVTLAEMYVTDGFGGLGSGVTIGTDSASLQINVTASLVIENRRMAYAKLAGAFGVLDVRTIGGGIVYVSSGTVTEFRGGTEGRFDIADAVNMTGFYTAGMSGTIGTDTTSPADLLVSVARGAVVEANRRVASGVVAGTLVLHEFGVLASAGTAKLTIPSTGRLDLRQSGNLAGEIEVQGGGELTTRNSPGFGAAATLTTLRAHPSARIDVSTSRLTFTNTIVVGQYYAPTLG